MKKFALLRLQGGGNQVIAECECIVEAEAILAFNDWLANHKEEIFSHILLDENGYAQSDLEDGITFCIAEYWQPFTVLKA